MTTTRASNAPRPGLIRRPTKAERLGHALVLAEARRLADGGHTPDDKVTSGNVAWTEERATPLAAAIVAILERHHIDTGDIVIRAAAGTLAVEAARHIEPGHAAEGRPWLQGSTAIAACANALYAADVNLNNIGTERALQSLADAVAARTLADQPAAPDPSGPAPTAGPAEAGTVDAADLLTGRSTAERTKSTIMNTTALGVAASLVAAVVYGAGLLADRPAPVLAAGIAAVVLALGAVAVLIVAVFPRPGTAKPASADELKAAAEHQAADPAARADAAAAEGAALLRINAAKAGLIRVAMFVLLAAACAAAAAVLIETL